MNLKQGWLLMCATSFKDEVAGVCRADSYSVTLCARETVSVLRRFIDHYRNADAEHIYMYFDGTQDEAREVCAAWAKDPLVTVTVCDRDFWQQIIPNIETPALEEKQVAACMMTIDINRSDWLLFCDSDEFLTAKIPIREVLAQVPDNQPGIRIRNTEAVWGVSDDVTEEFGCGFERRPSSNSFIGRNVLPFLVFGLDGRLMRRCMTGYIAGKHLLRQGVVPEKMSCHQSWVDNNRLKFLHELLSDDANARIVHFDAIGRERWHRKWTSRISGTTIAANMSLSRRRQERRIARSIEKGKGEQLFRQFYGLNRWQQFILTRLGLLRRIWD